MIARMVSQDGPDQTAFHFIALTPGREYQLSLLRPIVARLILKHDLSTTYFPDTSYPVMRDYFHNVLRQLSERSVQEVIYIDGLDQLEAEASGTRDLSFLPNSPPPGMVIVLGTRPDDTLQPLESKKVQVEYRLPHLSYRDFNHLLTQQGVVIPAAHRLYMALQGNAFYLALVVQELKAGPIADLDAFIQQISDNPENLFGLTFKRLRQDRTFWRAILHPILTLLLAAQEPLGIAVLRHLLDAEDDDVRTALHRLGGLVAQDSQHRFFLYHLKMRDYLEEDPSDLDAPFVVSQAQMLTMHTKLADWCVQATTDIEQIWNDTTGLEQTRRWYARHHYATHLVLEKQWETLSQVVDDATYGQYKCRFDPSTQLYALDLDRARDVAVTMDDLSRLWRWSLLRVSLASQMDAWPDALFLALVHLGRGSEALSRAELLSNANRKVAVLRELALRFDATTAQRVLSHAWATAAAITDNQDRATALRALVMAMTQAQHPDAAAAIDTAITSDWPRAEALRTLAVAQMQAGQWVNAQTTITAITKTWLHTSALRDLAVAMAQAQHPDTATTFARAVTATATITHDAQRARALGALAAAMAQAQHPDTATTFACAVTATAAITDDQDRAAALRDLAIAMAQAGHADTSATFALATTATIAITDRRVRTTSLRELTKALALAQSWKEAATTVAAITGDKNRAAALRELALAMATAQRWEEAIITAEAITNDREHAIAFNTLHRGLIQIGNMFVVRQSIATVWRRATTRTKLLTLAKIAHPLIAHDPDLGRAMADSFSWVDDQLREG